MARETEGGLSGSPPLPWRQTEAGAACLLILPMLVLFVFSTLYPLVKTLWLSLFDIRGLLPPKWVGFDNYVALFGDPNFRSALSVTLIWTLTTTALSVGIGWGLALLCSLAPRATFAFRILFFSTYGIAETVSGFIWLSIFRPDDSGLLNALLNAAGLGHWGGAWLGSETSALWCLAAAYSWAGVGLPLIVCFASIQSISRSVLEAAALDGARSGAMMRHIFLPLSLPGLSVALFINLLGSLRAFDMIFLLTNGGPVRSTETLGYFMYRESMQYFKLGYGAAATVVLLLAVIAVSVPFLVRRTAEVR